MQTVCLELSKYVLAFLMAFYALAAYRGAVIRNEDKRKKIYRIQNVIMVIVHFTGYLIMYVVYDDMNYIYLYFAQLVYLFSFIFISYYCTPVCRECIESHKKCKYIF